MTDELSVFSHNLGKVLNEWVKLSNLLIKDIESLEDAYQDDQSSQPFRRILVRSCRALIEGEVFGLKQFTLHACEVGGMSLAADERVFLSEVQMLADDSGNVREKGMREGALENLKRTLRIATSKFQLGWAPDFSNQGWEELRHSLELRHRITHPKTVGQLAGC